MKVLITALVWLIAMAAMPAARAAEDALVMGVFPRFNASETTTRYTPLADHLSARLGRKITVVTSKDFHSFWRGIDEQRYEIVQYNQYHYIRSAKNYQVIAHNKEFGKSTIAGALYVTAGIFHWLRKKSVTARSIPTARGGKER